MTDQASKRSLGLYCHVPFCPATCDFCAFYQVKPYRRDLLAFMEGIEKEMTFHSQVRKVDTFYCGGGTPGLLSANDIGILGRTLLAPLEGPLDEWTVEMTPSTVNPEKTQALIDLGVNRISMGVQSFNEDLLAKMGRPHTVKLVFKAIDILHNAGFDNINLDIIIAVPGQTLKMLEADLNQAASLKPRHLSTYCLTYEKDTPLWRRLCKRGAPGDSDEEADYYLKAWEVLEAAGYRQYEISNFAQPGFECLHNLNTWKMHQWIGLGPSAASQYDGRRYSNAAGLEEWLSGLRQGVPIRCDERRLDVKLLVEDTIVFGLRMNQGFSPALLEEQFEGIDLSNLDPLWNEMISADLLERKPGHHLALTKRGRLLADRIAVEVLSALESADL